VSPTGPSGPGLPGIPGKPREPTEPVPEYILANNAENIMIKITIKTPARKTYLGSSNMNLN
jgi:hypothetical protein